MDTSKHKTASIHPAQKICKYKEYKRTSSMSPILKIHQISSNPTQIKRTKSKKMPEFLFLIYKKLL